MTRTLSRYTVFETPGTFDLRSLSTMGLNAKPNSINPIGHFGTGLKYAIAILLRMGANIDLWCNGDHYTFFTKPLSFRGSQFQQVYYRKENAFLKFWAEAELPYTTEYGKEWELWQAFRELYANTLDEGGTVYNTDPYSEPNPRWKGEDGFTFIIVDSVEFAHLVQKRHEIFLDPSRTLRIDTPDGNVTEGTSMHLYYRGMRAYDLPEDRKAIFTYNIIDQQELTEDRTLKYAFSAEREIVQMVSQSEDKQFIKQVLTAPDKTLEASLEFEYIRPSKAFKEVLTEIRDHKRLNRSARSYYSSYISPPKEPKVKDSIWEEILQALEDANEACIEELGDYPERDSVMKHYLKAFQERFER